MSARTAQSSRVIRRTEEADHGNVLREAAGVERDGDRLGVLAPGLIVANEELERPVPDGSELEWKYNDNDNGGEELDCGEL